MPDHTHDVDTLAEALAAELANHADCRIVTSRAEQTIWSCGVQTPPYDRTSTVGFVDLHRLHVGTALAARTAQAPADQPAGPVAGPWLFGPENAARFLAATAWPWEREENRDSWAPRMLTDTALFELEHARAQQRLLDAATAIRAALSAADQATPPGADQ